MLLSESELSHFKQPNCEILFCCGKRVFGATEFYFLSACTRKDGRTTKPQICSRNDLHEIEIPKSGIPAIGNSNRRFPLQS